jgi:hypothetical protein
LAAVPNRVLESAVTPAATFTGTPVPSATATLPQYPHLILPDADRLREIFLEGERNGMRQGVFSKVGDSLTANSVFLVPFGSAEYALGEYGYLQEAIDFFSREIAREGNSFANDSLAARTGWRAEDAVDPSKNRPPCRMGESPLLCEYRIVRPALAIILLGTNDASAPNGTFAESIQQIVELSLERGILPILTTLPELRGKDVGSFNAVIRDLAAVRQIPLIDLSAALAKLPNRGVGPDGVHLSWVEPAVFEPQYLKHGMTVRNLLTLQALDAAWKAYPPLENAQE